jgi:hypothetical protein
MMAMIERDARRMAAALDDYSLLTVAVVAETERGDYEIEVIDGRFNRSYVIGSHFDYWDFLSYFISHQMWPAPEGHLSAA